MSNSALSFTWEDTMTLPTMLDSPYPDMQPIHMLNHGAEKILLNLDAPKATGLDGVPARLLKEGAVELAPMLMKI